MGIHWIDEPGSNPRTGLVVDPGGDGPYKGRLVRVECEKMEGICRWRIKMLFDCGWHQVDTGIEFVEQGPVPHPYLHAAERAEELF